ncbi:MAG: HAMP domain-containing sensor histidine kinase [Caulobacteraceae bacterium]
MTPGRDVWRTTTFRLTIAFGAAFALGIVLLLGLVYIQTAGYLTRRVDHILAAEIGALSRSRPEALPQLLRQASARDPLNAYGLFSADGQWVAGDVRLTPVEIPPDGVVRDVSRRRGSGPRRAIAERLPWGEILIVHRDASQLVELRRIILQALIWSGATIAILGVGLAMLLSARPLRRIQAMREASAAIGAGDMTVRMPTDASRDELDELARIVNVMMDEVERLMTQARTVGEGVAHELRTPLTRLRATLDHARQALDPGDSRGELLDACVAETDGVLIRFRALLRIAAVEARSRRSGIDRVSLRAIVEQAAELYAPLAVDRDVELEVVTDADIEIRADGELMFEALSNLLDNALKFTAPGGTVRLSLTREAEGPVLEVRDNGVGIPVDERPLVTKRFYRSRATAAAPGHGLGLSLVAAVADLHGFRLSIDDARPGTVVRLACRQ